MCQSAGISKGLCPQVVVTPARRSIESPAKGQDNDKTMTPQGLRELREIASEVDDLREKASGLMVRLITLYQEDEDVENLGAHDSLTQATGSLQKAAWRLWRAVTKIRDAHTFEKDLMDFYEELSSRLHNDDR